MKTSTRLKTVAVVLLQWLGAAIGFVFCLVAGNVLLPLPQALADAAPATGFLSLPGAMAFNAVVNAALLIWVARRCRFRGLTLWASLIVLSFGAQTFQTQIESGYFLAAFPLLQGNFVLYQLVLRGFVSSLLFTGLVALLTGGFSRKPRSEASMTIRVDHAIRAISWLAAMYFVLYALFGYYVAWQSRELRLFYGGPAELNSFTQQWANTLMAKPELPVFQYFRGILWLLCLLPLFKGFTGKRVELVVLSTLALAVLPTAQLAFPNPLMPAGVSMAHFWEVAISTGVFGGLCAWFVPQDLPQNTLATKSQTEPANAGLRHA